MFKWHQMTEPETLTDIQRAARFFYLQHHAFDGLVMHDLGIKYSVANTHGQPSESRELVITNYQPDVMQGLF